MCVVDSVAATSTSAFSSSATSAGFSVSSAPWLGWLPSSCWLISFVDALLRMLNALFLRLGLLVADFRRVEGNFGQNTVQSGHTSVLLDLLETFYLGLVYINNYCAVNFV